MSEMVERVARAICKSQTQSDAVWQAFLPEARAAIAAMREPTWQMCSAGNVEHSKMVDDGIADASDPDCRYIYDAMIDAALKEVMG